MHRLGLPSVRDHLHCSGNSDREGCPHIALWGGSRHLEQLYPAGDSAECNRVVKRGIQMVRRALVLFAGGSYMEGRSPHAWWQRSVFLAFFNSAACRHRTTKALTTVHGALHPYDTQNLGVNTQAKGNWGARLTQQVRALTGASLCAVASASISLRRPAPYAEHCTRALLYSRLRGGQPCSTAS
jgi:hypothetical protein